MFEILSENSLAFVICYAIHVAGKCIISKIISDNNDLSDAKAKYMTQMMTKDINIKRY